MELGFFLFLFFFVIEINLFHLNAHLLLEVRPSYFGGELKCPFYKTVALKQDHFGKLSLLDKVSNLILVLSPHPQN